MNDDNDNSNNNDNNNNKNNDNNNNNNNSNYYSLRVLSKKEKVKFINYKNNAMYMFFIKKNVFHSIFHPTNAYIHTYIHTLYMGVYVYHANFTTQGRQLLVF